MEYKFTIDGKLPSLNEFIAKNRSMPALGNRMKQDNQRLVEVYIAKYLRKVHIDKPVYIEYTFYEPNKKRDLDNISGFAHKVIQDALVESGVLHNDSWLYIIGFSDRFEIDKDYPRIEVIIKEV
jgi:Holliday junction resolvase RusA-like endonuclease